MDKQGHILPCGMNHGLALGLLDGGRVEVVMYDPDDPNRRLVSTYPLSDLLSALRQAGVV